MKSSTAKFLLIYNEIYKVEKELENEEIFLPKKQKEILTKSLKNLREKESRLASKITENEFNDYLGDLCINNFEEFQDAYHVR